MKSDIRHPDPASEPAAVVRLIEQGDIPPARAEALLAEIAFPIAEKGAVTFAWTGEADRVELVRWIHAGIDRRPFRRVPGTHLWVLRLQVPDSGRFEYKLAVHRDGHEEWMLDPRNREVAADPFGENSVCRTFGYERPSWTKPQGSPPGRILPFAIDSAVFGAARDESVYLPAGYRRGRIYPLVVVHDGQDYNDYADLSVSLDNLIARGDIPPVIAMLTQAHDRLDEYPKGRRHSRYLVDELLPALSARFPISGLPSERVLLGASLGAVASLATALRRPGVFGGLVLKSGSFILDERKLIDRPHVVFHRVARLLRAMRRAPDFPPMRIFVSTGELEGLASENRALADLLRCRGVDVLLKTAWDGHHWHNWRNQLRDGLMWVLNRDEDE